MSERGILVANLGSPDAPDVPSVRRYLGEFLMDPFVIDTPWLVRRMIVSGFILPTRPKQTAHAYQSIWREDGSPLIAYTRLVAEQIEAKSGLRCVVGMRYGSPSLADAIEALGDVDEILLMALYPQHADSTRTTTIQRVRQLLEPRGTRLLILPPYYDRPEFTGALTQTIKAHAPANLDHLLFSYHGLPERHILKADPTGSHCLATEDCCTTPSRAHATCYRHQCLMTTSNVGSQLGIDFSFSFQSRLGRLPWLTPYTDERVLTLAASGIENLAVVCPSFAVDNLETLEEIGIRSREAFLAGGGKSFTLVPALNDEQAWTDALAGWANAPASEFEAVG